MHFFNKNRLFPILVFSIGLFFSSFLASSLNEEFLRNKEDVESLEANFPLIIFFLGMFVSAAFLALIWLYQGLFKKKEELSEAKKMFVSANTALQAKNAELEESVYAVSHDLQEPLNTINGWIEALREDHLELDDEEIKRYFTLISSTSTRMRKMIKELLIYAKLGTNRKPELVNIEETVEETIEDLGYVIEKSGAIINLSENLPTIRGYQLELKLLFQNLLINAIKYQKSDVKPIVNISFESNHLENKFTIHDNGIGIEEKHQKSIFKLFQRLHNSSKYEGSGIGLAKCKKIIELHKGAIWVESKLNQGSKFHFVIPN